MNVERTNASGHQLPELVRLMLGLVIDYIRWVSLENGEGQEPTNFVDDLMIGIMKV